MDWKTTYEKWYNHPKLDADMKVELEKIGTNESELEDSFYQNLAFGTGGLRGVMGPGTNRMNTYTVRKAVAGLAAYIENHVEHYQSRGVAVGYDSRYNSREFAIEAARVLGAKGIQTYVFESLRPTPYLSFAVRYLHAAAGIMITASHNPPEYNGFKVYNDLGGQTPPEQADKIYHQIEAIEDEIEIDTITREQAEADGKLVWIGDTVDKAYLQKLATITKNEEAIKQHAKDVKVVFTPLHGTAHLPVKEGLEQLGFNQVYVVKEQAEPDPEFSTVASPNPEEHQAFEHAIQLGEEVDADMLIGTDPDADRLGVAVRNGQGEFEVLTGNQLGALMLDYILSQADELPEDGRMIKTIVTSELGRAIADYYHIPTIETLTGFKFIGEKIQEFYDQGEGTFLFGYEESYGYLVGDFVRDKDAVQAAMLSAEMAAYWKGEGKSLHEALHSLFDRFGYYLEGLESTTLKGKDGSEKIQSLMNHFRSTQYEQIGEFEVATVEDYEAQTKRNQASGSVKEINLPKADVIKFHLADGSWCCLRPSGTEPKIKCYFGVNTPSVEESEKKLKSLKEAFMNEMNKVLYQEK
ncbi:phosphoglucomutase [Pontibacillus halophilus JSM 076056 = DSM 19796]|uniref:Phosphoglucomutase n=1 Tax=Pontibacillus halophilus JSM 076056 = DSM 19796 TaxID=1385510 RepID=A0A0A5GP86_9BACI|nr:phospho-sugar mutase [Pontibacillus halophilus]KGX93804.1 phosphoglucomutase [Pontibacillus halophilus JSM 076056 = DSM 19796]